VRKGALCVSGLLPEGSEPQLQRAGSPEPSGGVLYLVGTPIGHLGDLSPRARMLLERAGTIACEDTRRTGQLLHAIGNEGPPGRRLVSFHRHNCRRRLPELLSVLAKGEPLALVSDAGLPGISDPGEDLVAAAREAGHAVVCVPGPCALTTALVSSGLPAGRFCFEGFLPARRTERRSRISQLKDDPRTVVLYEAPHRLVALLEDLLEELGDRPAQVSRELTKRHEEQVGCCLSAALRHFLETPPQGEITLVVGGAPDDTDPQWGEAELLQALEGALAAGASASEAARDAARRSGQPRRRIYQMLHQPPSQ